ncbi:hypothetical protein SAY87_019316 [Trapa incisa]|uniref:OTU domain-containing protein n=1 Tax=Trapa incisa TaxID=236973 RepID=A0AAN7Q740_9MYRT|nr:hypothetical protein SAY87_019316 [Trapa incisa]
MSAYHPDDVCWGIHLLDDCSITNAEELSPIAFHVPPEESTFGIDNSNASVLAEDWVTPSKIFSNSQTDAEENDPEMGGIPNSKEEAGDVMGTHLFCSGSEKISHFEDDVIDKLHIVDELGLDGEVGKRLNQMHGTKVDREIPLDDEEVSDHQRLLNRLGLYGLVENRIQGDGNCQVGFIMVLKTLFLFHIHHMIEY